MSGSFYITTPIYYVNDMPHIGHIYTTVMADIFARYHRMLGEDVYFLTGTDEHGQKIDRTARERGLAPKELADRVVERYHDLWERLEISHDDFIRTSEPRHQRAVHEMIGRLKRTGDIYRGEYTGWYCAGCEAFFPESQLVDGCCPDQGHPVEKLSEPSYFFRLSAYRDRLLRWYRENPGCIRPRSRYNEVVRFVEGGLNDLSVSRTSLKWGVPWPDDPDHVVYVWLDALTNYVSALGFGSDDDTLYGKYWPAQVHLVGKDILRFHCVYWPAFLMSAGLPLPETVFGHGWWQRKGSKMSKSLGNVVRPDAHMERFGADALRYFLAREMVFGQDASFSDAGYVERYHADLANQIGNAAARTVSMVERYLDGVAPAAPGDGPVPEAAVETAEVYRRHMEAYEPSRALEKAWGLMTTLNGFIQESQPWSLAKQGDAARQKLEATLGTALECLRLSSLLIEPVMPATAARLREQIGAEGLRADVESGFSWGVLPAGTKVRKGEPLFPRIDGEKFLEEIVVAAEKAEEESMADQITIDELFKVELTIGRVDEAERIPKSNKLLRLMVDIGEEKPRQVVAGMADKYDPADLMGRRVVVVANLKPAKLMGVESQGMVLAAEVDGEPFLLAPDGEVAPGSTVR